MKFSLKTKKEKNDYWFKPKKYGYGFYPCTWQGWIAILIFVSFIFLAGYSHGLLIFGFEKVPTLDERVWAKQLIDTLLISGMFNYTFASKVKGGLKWRWGKE